MNSLTNNSSAQEQAIKTFLSDHLNKSKNGQTLMHILDFACKYYDADRSYIFELNTEHTAVSNTYEQCRDGISPRIDELRNIPFDGIEYLNQSP